MGIAFIADETRTPTQFGGSRRSGGTVRLTPLGLWAVQRMASRVTSAPVVGALRSSSAAELLRAAADLPEDVGAAEIDAWIEHHGRHAAGELCAAIRDADETGRGLAFRALLHIGIEAADAVETLADDPEFASFVTVWRVDTLAASPEEMDRSGDPEGWVRLLHTVVNCGGRKRPSRLGRSPQQGHQGSRRCSTSPGEYRDTAPKTCSLLSAVITPTSTLPRQPAKRSSSTAARAELPGHLRRVDPHTARDDR